MPRKRKVFDTEGHAHFITFSCYKRRRLLDTDQAKRIVIGEMAAQLRNLDGRCIGFVVMPNHVHTLVWFTQPLQSSHFIQLWKQNSSRSLSDFLRTSLKSYAKTFTDGDPIWQTRYYDFNVGSEQKCAKKLEYMHQNPVKAGFVTDPCEWQFSSARFYVLGKSVGVLVGMDLS